MKVRKIYLDYLLSIIAVLLALLLIFCKSESRSDDPDPVNDPPEVFFTGTPFEGRVDEEFHFTAQVNDDGWVDLEWSFGDGGTTSTTTYVCISSDIGADYTYGESNTYTVRVTADDRVNDPVTAETQIKINPVNSPPTADAGEDKTGSVNVPVSFNGTAEDADNDTLTFLWDFDDGNTSTEEDPTHTYDGAGTYTVTFTVDDGVNDPVSDTATVTINENSPPTADAGEDKTGFVNVPVSFNGTAEDIDGDTLAYYWDFDDGGTSTAEDPTHTYAGAGTYTVTFTVDDGVNDPVSDTATVEISVANLPPVADVGGIEGEYRALPGVERYFDGSGSYDPESGSLTYSWDFGDGDSGTGETTFHAYATVGNYSVTLTVDDGENVSDPDSASIVFVEQSLPDTGQEDCYTFGAVNCDDLHYTDPPFNYSYGQDAHYGDNTLDLTDSDPIVTDNKTGLVWEMDGNGSDAMTWTEANTHCSGLTYDGATAGDWRLPSRRELLSIVSYGHSTPAIYDTVFTDTGLFPGYWTNTPVMTDPDDLVWTVGFYEGTSAEDFSNWLSKTTDDAYVRCVKGPSFAPDDHDFEIMADYTITDWDTGLNWQWPASDTTMNWFEALYYCENEVMPIGDWRLPNIKELESSVSLNWYDPAVLIWYFTDVDTDEDPREDYWSSTSNFTAVGLGAWQVNVKNGDVFVTSGKDAYQGYVRCVRKMPDEK